MEPFYTQSEEVQHIIKGLNLTKSLFVSSIVIGEPNIGKKHLVTHIFPDTQVVSGEDQEMVEQLLQEHDELIITHFEKLKNHNTLNFDNKRIIATADYITNQHTIDSLFAFIYHMPSLKERPEDTRFIANKFLLRSCKDLMINPETVDLQDLPLNLTQNTRTMKRAIYHYLMHMNMEKEDIQQTLYNYLYRHLDGNNGYKEHLELYEVPLIEAGLKKFRSQLQLSQVLGINRNTLRKKIHEHRID